MQQAEYRFGSGTIDLIESGSETLIKTMDPQSEKIMHPDLRIKSMRIRNPGFLCLLCRVNKELDR